MASNFYNIVFLSLPEGNGTSEINKIASRELARVQFSHPRQINDPLGLGLGLGLRLP